MKLYLKICLITTVFVMILFSCKKKEPDTCDEFQQIYGKWKRRTGGSVWFQWEFRKPDSIIEYNTLAGNFIPNDTFLFVMDAPNIDIKELDSAYLYTDEIICINQSELELKTGGKFERN